MFDGYRAINLGTAVVTTLLSALFALPPMVCADPGAAVNTPAIPSDVKVMEKKIDGNTCTIATITVNAPSEKVWTVMTDWQNTPKLFHNLKVCEVIDTKGDTK